MKINTQKSLTATDMMSIVEPITVDDLQVNWNSEAHHSGQEVSMSAKVGLAQDVVDRCVQLFGTDYRGVGHQGFLGFFVHRDTQACQAYVSIVEEYSLRGVRKDKHEAKKAEAFYNLAEKDTAEARAEAINKFLSGANTALTNMITVRNDDTLRDSMNRVKGQELSQWADKQDESIAAEQAEITQLSEQIAQLKKSIKSKRTKALADHLDTDSDQYDVRVVEGIRSNIMTSNVFNENRFGL